MASSKDFTANQIRTAKLILTGTQPGDGGIGVRNIGLAVYDESAASNDTGGITDAATFNTAGKDVAIFISGSTKSRDTDATSAGGVVLFGGDTYVSGTLVVKNAGRTHGSISGSIHHTAAGVSYLVAGSNITITSASNGQVTIASGPGADGMGTGFVLEDGDSTEVTITQGKEVKFVEGNAGIEIDWTDTDNGTDGDPYDLTFTPQPLTFAASADGGSASGAAEAMILSETFTFKAGANITLAMASDEMKITAADTNTTITVKEGSTTKTTNTTEMSFTGAGVSVSGAGTAATITIPGGGGGGDQRLLYGAAGPRKFVNPQYNNIWKRDLWLPGEDDLFIANRLGPAYVLWGPGGASSTTFVGGGSTYNDGNGFAVPDNTHLNASDGTRPWASGLIMRSIIPTGASSITLKVNVASVGPNGIPVAAETGTFGVSNAAYGGSGIQFKIQNYTNFASTTAIGMTKTTHANNPGINSAGTAGTGGNWEYHTPTVTVGGGVNNGYGATAAYIAPSVSGGHQNGIWDAQNGAGLLKELKAAIVADSTKFVNAQTGAALTAGNVSSINALPDSVQITPHNGSAVSPANGRDIQYDIGSSSTQATDNLISAVNTSDLGLLIKASKVTGDIIVFKFACTTSTNHTLANDITVWVRSPSANSGSPPTADGSSAEWGINYGENALRQISAKQTATAASDGGDYAFLLAGRVLKNSGATDSTAGPDVWYSRYGSFSTFKNAGVSKSKNSLDGQWLGAKFTGVEPGHLTGGDVGTSGGINEHEWRNNMNMNTGASTHDAVVAGWVGFTADGQTSTGANNKFTITDRFMHTVTSRTITIDKLVQASARSTSGVAAKRYAAGDVMELAIARNELDSFKLARGKDGGASYLNGPATLANTADDFLFIHSIELIYS